MRWCFFSPGFRSLNVLSGDSRDSGGAEAQVAHLASALAEAGHEVTMIYGWGAGAAPPARIAGVRCLDAAPAWTRPGSLAALWRVLNELSPDVIYARLPSDFLAILGLFARLHRGTRFLYALAHDAHCRARSAWDHRRWFHAPLYALGLQSAHTIAVQHEGQARLLRRGLRARSVQVPNIVRSRVAYPRCFHETTIDVAWIGKIRPEKRLDRLFDLAAALPDLRIAVVGGFDPTMDEASRRMLERRGANLANVSMLGPLRADEVQRVLVRSRLLVVTSDSEGFPNVMLEAWAAGVPVVSLIVDPGAVITREGIGLVSGTAAQLRQDVAALVGDQGANRRLGALGFAYVRRRHSVESVLRALAEGAAPTRLGVAVA